MFDKLPIGLVADNGLLILFIFSMDLKRNFDMFGKKVAKRSPFIDLFATPTGLMLALLGGEIITRDSIIIGFLLSIPIYKIFSIFGRRTGVVYSLFREKAILKRGQVYGAKTYYKKMSLMTSFYLLCILEFVVAGETGNGILMEISQTLGFLIFFYIVIDLVAVNLVDFKNIYR